jgi:molybdopterin-containing oxidoreductase family membrane subunit
MDLPVGEAPIRTLTHVLRVTVAVNLFMLGSELFTAFYTGGAHATSARYLFFGAHGKTALVPWTWSSVALNLGSLLLLIAHRRTDRFACLNAACAAAFAGVWIEKGHGPHRPRLHPLHPPRDRRVPPNLSEWKITAGIWALGLMILTAAAKLALPVLSGRVRGPTDRA